ncbi:PHP domain-containing protein [Candidatus Bathyarchaeota archaeon]|nr:PHP domain-containing protein [Candidatus Bathyarchaeota archaeon]
MIYADLHVHTKYSADASIPPKTIVDRLHAHSLIKAVAITDHNTVEGYYKVRELASAYEDIIIIPGVEISAAGGDIIVLGVTELPHEPWTVKNILAFAKERQAIAIVAHPYRAYGLGDSAKKYTFDAVEVLNGSSASNANKLAQNLAKEMNLPGIAGSDAHQIDELWSAYTEIQASSNIDEILKAIKKGFVRVTSAGKSIHF